VTSKVWIAPAVAALVLAGACTGSPAKHPNQAPSTVASVTSPSAAISPSSSSDLSPLVTAAATAPAKPQELPTIDPVTLDRFYKQKLDWTACGSGLQCAGLEVPVDYQKPSGSTLRLSVIRHQAQNPQGSLLINPGGPGGSGVQFLKSAWRAYDSLTDSKFDIVSFDPRGVGSSRPVDCVTPREEDTYLSYDADPGNAAEVAQVGRLDAEFASGCEEDSGSILSHIGTPETARDLDVLRAAVGDDKLTYVGESYGTFLGAIYAQLFPTHIRALVLDGAIDPSLNDLQEGQAQAEGFETNLNSFIADCVKKSGCALGSSSSGTSSEAEKKLDAWLNGLEQTPLTAGGRELTRTLAATGLAAALYNPRNWPRLNGALTAAFRGDASGMLALADSLTGRRADGTYSNLVEANVAINCADRGTAASSITQAAAAAAAVASNAPTFGELIGWGNPVCITWPVPAEMAPGPVRADGAPPIVVIGTLRDPATPFAWAKSLAGQLASGVLVSFDGDGHTAVLRGSPCIGVLVRDYLVSLKVPDDGTACGPVS
jgi:pimeloyl-ACP methyl ester carboxylesterase